MSQLSLTDLPDDILSCIFKNLSVSDLTSLRQVSKSMLNLVDEESTLWNTVYCSHFGNIMEYVQIFTENTQLGVELDEEQYIKPNKYWKSLLIEKLNATEESEQLEIEKAQPMYVTANNLINESKNHPEKTKENIDKAVPLLLNVLELVPTHAPSFHLLAFICYILNGFTQSLQFIELCEGVDPDYKEIEGLKNDVVTFLEKTGENERHAALIVDGDLSDDLVDVLTHIFNRFDKDKDEALNRAEFNSFAFATSHQNITNAFWQSLRQTFPCDAKGNLSLDGFLELYLKQTLEDPDETWKDLRTHGYNSFLQLEDSAKLA